MRGFILILAVVMLLFLGCVNPANTVNQTTDTTTTEVVSPQPPINTGPGDDVVYCLSDNLEENAECFEEAFVSCAHIVGTFWSTSDGFPLTFESVGLDASGKCDVRVTVSSDDLNETVFAGQSASCLIEQSPAGGEHATPFFDSYLIGPSTCTGTYVDSIQTMPADNDSTSAEDTAPTEDPAPEAPVVSTKEFSITVNEKGVEGENTFTVQKGDIVKLHITVDKKDVSFNGEQVLAPANKNLDDDEYIFNSGHMAPGQTKTFEFVADESFDFGIYWPGPSVLKGKGHIVVEE